MDIPVFNLYTQFFTHVESICYHIQQESFQIQSAETIRLLTSSSISVLQQLENSKNIAEKTLEHQKTVEQFTEKLAQQELRQQNAFEELREWIKSDVVKTMADDLLQFHQLLNYNSNTIFGAMFYFGVFGMHSE